MHRLRLKYYDFLDEATRSSVFKQTLGVEEGVLYIDQEPPADATETYEQKIDINEEALSPTDSSKYKKVFKIFLVYLMLSPKIRFFRKDLETKRCSIFDWSASTF